MHKLTRVLFQMEAFNADPAGGTVLQVNFDIPVGHDGTVGLGNLVSRRQVGVIIILARENRFFIDRGIQAVPCPDGLFNAFMVDNGQHSRESRVDERHVRIRLGSESGRRPAEQLRIGNHLAVHFQTDDDFPVSGFAFDNIRHDINLPRASDESACRTCFRWLRPYE